MTGASGMLSLSMEASGVQYHPRMEHLFATSDSSGCVCLRDARMSFGCQRQTQGVVQAVRRLLTCPQLEADHSD